MSCWTGDLVTLKQFIEPSFNLHGKWKSPGDERTSFSDGKTTITWWRNKKMLHFYGKDASKLEQKCCILLMGNEMNDDNKTRPTRGEHSHTNNINVQLLPKVPKLLRPQRRQPLQKNRRRISKRSTTVFTISH